MPTIISVPRYLIGIDEAGRGPLAGPVAVGVFAFLNSAAQKKFQNFRDSKQLSEEGREEWYSRILAECERENVCFKVSYASQEVIDTQGLTLAIKSAMRESLNCLAVDFSLYPMHCRVLLDGGLKAPAEYIHQETIIKGDEKRKAIALASIVAKVERDRLMKEYAKKYKGYGFEEHKGYATPGHYKKLKKLGTCPLHRKSFLKNLDFA
jgi:ribonuclease HII